MATDVTNDRVVCHCLGITESEVRCAIAGGTSEALRTVMRATGAGTGCTACLRSIKALLADQCAGGSSSSPTCVTR